MIALCSILFALAHLSNADIISDLNCTTYDGALTAFVYTPAAVACQNAIADAACEKLYVATNDGPVKAGTKNGRPFACYSLATAAPAPVSQDMKTAALASCAKTCGLCCQTDAYNCKSVDFPRINCATITATQCNSPAWRTIIAQDCPSACGFCGQGGCVDAVTNCGTDLSICQNIGMQDFVNNYCQKTCSRCTSATTASGPVTTGPSPGTCTSFIADTVPMCAAWASNGFCTNTFYTAAQRRARCASTCRVC